MARVADAVNFYGVRSNRVNIGYAGSQKASLYPNEPLNRGQVESLVYHRLQETRAFMIIKH